MKKRPPSEKPLIDKDGEVRELTMHDFVKMVPLRDVFPELAAYSEARRRGRPKTASPKKLISFKLSQDLIKAIRGSGAGYSARVEQALRNALEKGLI